MPTFNRQVGVTEMPAGSAVINIGTLEDFEPGPSLIGDVIKAGVNADFGARWRQALSYDDSMYKGTEPIHDVHVFPVLPSKAVLQAVNMTLPALLIYPAAPPTSKRATMKQMGYVQQWCVDYVMGPLLPGALVRLGWMLHSFAKATQQIIRAGGHPSYAQHSLLGVANPGDGSSTSNPAARKVFYESSAGFPGFTKLTWVGSTGIGGAVFEGTDSIYYASSVVIETEQRDGIANAAVNAVTYSRGDFTMTGDEEGDRQMIDMQSTPS